MSLVENLQVHLSQLQNTVHSPLLRRAVHKIQVERDDDEKRQPQEENVACLPRLPIAFVLLLEKGKDQVEVRNLVGEFPHDEFGSPELGKPMQVLECLVHSNRLYVFAECYREELVDKAPQVRVYKVRLFLIFIYYRNETLLGTFSC